MNKKILAGVLAAVSMLSVSATAFATTSDDTSSESTTQKYDSASGAGATYNVTAGVSYGTVDVTIPKTLDGVIINPYGAAVKTEVNGTSIASKSAIASQVYEIKNNDATDGIKVMATVAVTKASGVVVVDGTATTPDGWTEAGNTGTWDPLVSYDKITAKTDKTSGATTYTGGAVAAKQTKNVALRLLGAADAENSVATIAVKNGTTTKSYNKDTKKVEFAPKGNTTGELGSADASGSVFFSVDGDINPNLPADTEWTAKDTLSLSVVLKVLPVVND